MTSGYVLFRLADHTFATPLDVVREIVRRGADPVLMVDLKAFVAAA